MAEKEDYDASREAMREVTDRPERTRSHEEQLLRYLSGVEYHEEQEKARERREKPRERREEIHRGGPAMTTARTWTVDIYIDEHEDQRRTHAEARLHTRDRTELKGEGVALRKPSDQEVPEIGDELAVARALADLSHRLMDAAAEDIEQLSRPR